MKRPVVTVVLLFAVAGLAGCPIYGNDNNGCSLNSDCGQNYVCDTQSGACVLPSANACTKPADCDSTYTCTPAGACVPGDCTLNGCVGGYHCDSSSGVWGCIPNGSAGAAGASGAASAGQSGTTDQGGQGGAAGQSGSAGQTAVESGTAGMSAGGVAGGS